MHIQFCFQKTIHNMYIIIQDSSVNLCSYLFLYTIRKMIYHEISSGHLQSMKKVGIENDFPFMYLWDFPNKTLFQLKMFLRVERGCCFCASAGFSPGRQLSPAQACSSSYRFDHPRYITIHDSSLLKHTPPEHPSARHRHSCLLFLGCHCPATLKILSSTNHTQNFLFTDAASSPRQLTKPFLMIRGKVENDSTA